ncbi:hypothetical protein QA601_16235 [Chitinispirillales bacterium ANBcel5]|uniref:hypothetical protein n=1 Tax=Cellulosispirillum alkaliphilum TaxID=3039283 RepID=UPI002A51B226|nr:hypothetical protein [Chitinispirillales bacterium ANBcel5]
MQNNKKLDMSLKKLKELFKLIESEAKDSPAFLEKLAIIFGQEFYEATNIQSGDKKTKKPILNIVDILHRSGQETLLKELDVLTNDQLAKLASQEGIKKFKDAKSAERQDLIESLSEIASNRLSQGSSFTKPQKEPDSNIEQKQ